MSLDDQSVRLDVRPATLCGYHLLEMTAFSLFACVRISTYIAS